MGKPNSKKPKRKLKQRTSKKMRQTKGGSIDDRYITVKIRMPKKKKKTKSCPLVRKCAPGAVPNPSTCSCLSRGSLLKIANQWNHTHSDKINVSSHSPSDKIWSQINEKMKTKCNDEWCWIQQEFVKKLNDHDINNAYRPMMPKTWKQNKYEWLRTDDIENVMTQYEEANPDFAFIGPVPIDFDKEYGIGHCVVDELCKINIAKLKNKGITKIGVVFNLDPHDKPGSHWVSMFCSLAKHKGIYYFDSYGMNPPNEVSVLMKRLQSQARDIGIKLCIKHNNVRHQYQNSECGVYSLFFITQLLRGYTFNKLINSPIMDESMNRKRKFFFIEN